MYWKGIIGLTLGMLIFSSAYADRYSSPKHTLGVVVQNIEILANGSFRLLAKDASSTSGCYENGKLFKVYISSDAVAESAVKNMLSIVMLAYSLSKPIDIHHGDTLNCLVDSIQLSK